MAEKSDGETQWRPLDGEEMTRHHALFYSQGPIDGLLPGERARDLLLRSQLALPVLSQVWNLVDIPHDNMLDAAEFAVAMHLLRGYLCGLRLPPVLPPALRPPTVDEVRPPPISVRELLAYSQLFEVLDTTHRSFIDAITARDILVTSGLSVEQLAKVWNLADIDRDGRLTLDEFCIACHMVRFVKKGGFINGPVNVQSLLPHRTLKHDLRAKKRRLADLQSRKLKLMSIREKRKAQSLVEGQRSHLHQERLHCLRLWHALLSDDEGVSVETILHFGDRLKEEEDNVARIEAVAQRLNEAHNRVRQETARAIMDEQRLTQEVTALEEEADKQRKKRQRNSLIKDLDPFHQLHEERKEERLMGSKRPCKREEPKVEIPHKVDPFDRSKLHHKPLSGEKLFGVSPAEDTWGDARWQHPGEQQQQEEGETSWGGPVDERLEELTHGFEDDFVDVWAELCQGTATSALQDADHTIFSYGLDKHDPVFKTVPVTAEEDDLWCGLAPEELALQNEQLRNLRLKLNSINDHIEQLGGEQVIMEQAPLEDKAADNPLWKNPISRRRISSEGTLEYVGHSRTSGLTGATSLQRRNYGDAYNKARLLHDFSSRRSLSDSNQPTEASRGFIEEALKEKVNLGETVEGEESGTKEQVGEAVGEAAQKEVSQPHESQALDSIEKANSHSQKANGIKETCIEGQSASTKNESNNNVLKLNREELEKGADCVNAEFDTDKLEVESDALKSDPAKEDAQSNEIKLTEPLDVEERTKSAEDTNNESAAEILPNTESVPVESHQESLPSLISTKTQNGSDIKADKESIEKKNNTETGIESSVKAEVSDSDFRTSSPWNSQKTSDTFNPESVGVKEDEVLPLENQLVKKRHYVPRPQALDHRASLPPNFFSDHVSPVPPPRRNSPRKKLEKLRAGSTEGTPVKTAPPVAESGQSVRAPPLRAEHLSQLVTRGPPAAPSDGSLSPQRTSPKRRLPTPQSALPADDSSRVSRARPHSIAYLEHPTLALESPVAPPRTKRRSRKERQSSAPVGGSDAQTPQGQAFNEHEEQGVEGQPTGGADIDEDDMEAQQRKFELDRMRANLFGYDQSGSGRDSEGGAPGSNTVVLTLGDEDGAHSPKHQNQVVMNVASPAAVTSHQRGTTINISNNNSSPETSKGYKTNVRLDFGDDDISSFRIANQPKATNDAQERLDSLVHDGHRPYKTIVDLSEPEVKRNKPQTGNSRIVLDLDSHQYRPENVGPDLPRAVSTVTVEEEYMLQGRPAQDVGAKQVYKTDIYVSPQDSSTYESASNYEESESSTNLDASSLAKSEPDLSDDSDLSDAEGTFQATFEPGLHVDAGSVETRTCIKLDDDGDSGITLVSYHNRSDSMEDEKPTPSPPKKTTGVVLTLTPLTSPRTPVRTAPSPPRDDKPPAPRLIKMSRTDDSPPKETQALRMEARSTAVVSGLQEADGGGREGDDPSSRGESFARERRAAQRHASPPRPTVSALSPPRHKRPAPTPPPQAPTAQVHSQVDKGQVADNKCDNELSAVARTGTTVFHTTGTKYSPQQAGPSAEDSVGGRQGPDSSSSSSSSAGRAQVSATGHQLHWDSSRSGDQRPPDQQYTSGGSGATTTPYLSTGGADPLQPSGAPHSTPDLVQVTGLGSAPTSPDSMDPITGLRKTGPVSAVDKAVKFVAKTEPSFRVKKIDDTAPPAEVDGERATLIEAMRVRRKPVEWMPPAFDNTTAPETSGGKTTSEMLYEQRKAKNELNAMPASREGSRQAPPDVIPSYDTPLTPADIDASSINQESTKKLWEQQFASGEVNLFPRPESNRKKSISNQDISNFKSEVETDSIGALRDVKKQWELKAEELAKEKEDRERRISTSKSYDSLSMPRLNSAGDMPTSKSYDSLSITRAGKGHALAESPGEGDDDAFTYESAIDREVRLANEREKELRREQEARLARLRLAPSPPPSAPAPAHAPPPRPPQEDAAVALTAAEQLAKESIIEREIKEQQWREEQLRHEGNLQRASHTNKEHEQSEYERQEKEQERISAHESIVEREIRLQREREQDLQRLRTLVYKGPTTTTSHEGSPAARGPPSNHVSGSSSREDDLSLVSPAVAETEAAEESVVEPAPRLGVVPDHAVHPEVSSSPQQHVKVTPKAAAMTSSISYEDAISTYAHAGESMIARELREQKEREEELRRRWREELGLESPLEPSEPDTPYNMPDPVQPRSATKSKTLYDSSVADSALLKTQMAAPRAALVAGATGNGQKKVQPMSVSEDERDSTYRYVPQYETPIEREIRLAREREEEFRQMKGLGNVVSSSTDRSVVLDMKAESPNLRPHQLYRKGEEPVQEKATMKRLAHSRLQQEIEVEKQRELDLLRLGHITTTSEERKGETARYVDIVPKDPSPPPPPTAHTARTPTTPTPKTPTTPKAPAPVKTPTPPKASPPPPPPPQDATDGPQEPVPTSRKVTRAPVKPAGQRSMGELKIEQELREMREREEELKSQRKMISYVSDSPATNGAANGASEYVPAQPRAVAPSAPGDQLAKGPRRKSTLAEQWERKISGSS